MRIVNKMKTDETFKSNDLQCKVTSTEAFRHKATTRVCFEENDPPIKPTQPSVK